MKIILSLHETVVSINYNYLGFNFPHRIPTLQTASMGWLSKDLTPELFVEILDHGISIQSWFTNLHLEDLYPYSEFVTFTEKLKPIFLDAFNDKKELYFPGCNGLQQLSFILLNTTVPMQSLITRICFALTRIIQDLVSVRRLDCLLMNA